MHFTNKYTYLLTDKKLKMQASTKNLYVYYQRQIRYKSNCTLITYVFTYVPNCVNAPCLISNMLIERIRTILNV